MAQTVESACSAGDPSLIPGWEDPLKKETTTHSILLPGKSHGRRSLVGYSSQGCKEWDIIERFQFHTYGGLGLGT